VNPWFKWLAPAGFLALNTGCAVHYYDQKSGTEHVWGFAHIRMKGYPQSPERPLVVGTHMLGLNLRTGRDDYGIGVGFDSHSRITMPENGTLCMEWPTNVSPLPRAMRNLFTARVGTNLPPDCRPTPGTPP
jgi:hypothetical protein